MGHGRAARNEKSFMLNFFFANIFRVLFLSQFACLNCKLRGKLKLMMRRERTEKCRGKGKLWKTPATSDF